MASLEEGQIFGILYTALVAQVNCLQSGYAAHLVKGDFIMKQSLNDMFGEKVEPVQGE